MFKRHFLFLIPYSLLFTPTVYAQKNNYSDSLLNRISSLQLKESSAFIKGSFPAYISKSHKPLKRKEDCNIFYNALLGFTLNDIRSKLTPAEQLICDSITLRLLEVYTHFKNKNGLNTYNFWRTDTILMSPFSHRKKKLSKRLYLPDDLDCTSLTLLAMNTPQIDSIAVNVHELMQHYANQLCKGEPKCSPNNRNLHCINKKYRKFGAYYVWFGKKYPKIFDMCVLCNILTFVNHYNLTYTVADSASLQLIITEIKNGDYIKHPLIVSPYYGNTSVILYHLARVMKSGQIPQLDSLKPQLIKVADSIYSHSNEPFEKVLLASALMKWGVSSQWSVVSGQSSLTTDHCLLTTVAQSNFPFFIANIPVSFPYPIQKIYLGLKRGIYNYYCPAYYDALLLEYLNKR